MTPPPMQPAAFDAAQFLREYWQKKPYFIKDPWAAWSNPLEPDELAGLACRSDVESRLVSRSDGRWKLEHGPLPERRFSQLGQQSWTLLVQAVDHHVPAVAELLNAFRFVPNWRVDDVMVSYAVDGGGVGPHYDQYDVFLIQGLGKRRWQVGSRCDRSTPLLPDEDARLLARFEPSAEWLLEPGDILYLPPRIAHDGIALGDDCMTYSIGFRAPSRGELIAGWAESLLSRSNDDDRFADPGLPAQENPGQIAPEAITRLHEMVTETILDREAFAHWFAAYSTAPKNADIDWRPREPIGIEELHHHLANGAPLLCNPASRFSFIRDDAAAVSLFVDGRCFPCRDERAALAERLCARDQDILDSATLASAADLILELVNQGSVAFDLAPELDPAAPV